MSPAPFAAYNGSGRLLCARCRPQIHPEPSHPPSEGICRCDSCGGVSRAYRDVAVLARLRSATGGRVRLSAGSPDAQLPHLIVRLPQDRSAEVCVDGLLVVALYSSKEDWLLGAAVTEHAFGHAGAWTTHDEITLTRWLLAGAHPNNERAA